MAYLNLDLDYFDHPKTKRLVGLLGRGSDVLPVRLWCYCGKFHADTGDMTSYSPIELENLIGWWGQPGKAVEALAKLQFLDAVGEGYVVHDWASINGHIAALKERAQHGAAERWRRYREEKATKLAQAMLKQSPSNAISNAPNKEGKKDSSSSLLLDPDLLLKTEEESSASPVPDGSIEATRMTLLAAEFAAIRHAYPGTRRSLEVEWANLCKKHVPKDVIPLMLPAIERGKAYREGCASVNAFAPEWPYFSTWINQSRWTEEFGAIPAPKAAAFNAPPPTREQLEKNMQQAFGLMKGIAP